MADHGHLAEILIFLAAAVLIVGLAPRLGVGSVVGYLAAGILLGPQVLNLADPDELAFFAELGVVFLLFFIGLELSLSRLITMRYLVFGLGGLQVVATGLIIALIAWILGEPIAAAAVIGGALALSSTAIVLQQLAERGEFAARFGRISFAILLLQDLAIVPLLVLVGSLSDPSGSVIGSSLLAFAKAAGAIVAAFAIGRYVLHPFYRLIAGGNNHEILTALALATVLGAAYGLSLAGLSMALGAFLAGLVLSGSEFRHQVEADLRPIKGLLLGLFFIHVGLTVDLATLFARWPLVLGLAAALMLGKSLFIALLCRLWGQPLEVALRSGALLAQCGEFAFVIFAAASLGGLIAGETVALLTVAVGVTMVLTPAMDWLGRLAAHRLTDPAVADRERLAQETEDLEGHVIVAGFGRVGQTVARLVGSEGLPYVALDMNAPRVLRCRKENLPVYYGDAARLELLHSIRPDRARAAVVTLDNREAAERCLEALQAHWPDLPVLARAHDLEAAERLRQHGALAAVPEAVEGSLQLGASLLTALGRSPEEVAQRIDGLRADDYHGLMQMIGGGEAKAVIPKEKK